MVLLTNSKLFLFSTLPFTILGNPCTPKHYLDYDYNIKKFKENDPVRIMLRQIPADKPKNKNGFLLGQILLERENKDEAIEEVGRVLEQKDEIGKYRKVYVVRTRLEYLEKELLPPECINLRSRRERWVFILHSRSPKAEEIRQRVFKEYGSENKDASISTFANSLQNMYGDVSGDFRRVVDPEVLNELGKGDEENIGKVLDVLGVRRDAVNKKALKIIAGPLKSEMAAVHQEAEDEYKQLACVEIFPMLGTTFEADFTEEDVKNSFPLKSPTSVQIYPDRTSPKKTSIMAKFDNTEDAVEAFNNNWGWVTQNEVRMQLAKC